MPREGGGGILTAQGETMKATGIARSVMAVLILVGAFHANAQLTSAAGRMEDGRIKEIFMLAQRSVEEDYNVNFCGFFVGMSWHDCAALCKYYRLTKEDCTFWREDENAVWQIQISLKGIRRITKGGNTFDELVQAVASHVGDMKLRSVVTDEWVYEYKTIDGVVVTMSESNGLVIRNENVKSKKPVETSVVRQERARAEKMKQARQSIDETVMKLRTHYVDFSSRVQACAAAVELAEREVKVLGRDERQEAVDEALQPLSPIKEDVNLCRAAVDEFGRKMHEQIEQAQAADGLAEPDEETFGKLVELCNGLVDDYNRLVHEKWLTDATLKLKDIDARLQNYRASSPVQKLRLAAEKRAEEKAAAEKREREEREAAERRAAAEEKAAAEVAAAEKLKALVEEERSKAKEAFDELACDLKRIDWDRCMRQLTRLRDGMKTREGKEAVKDQLHKVEAMEGMQKHFVEHARGFGFKDKRGQLLAVVTKADGKSLTIQKAKYVKGKPVPGKETRVEWGRFYGLGEKIYLTYMNQFINELVMKGQDRDKTRVGPREWSDNMLGAALTLQLLYSEEKGVDKFIPVLVKRAVKGFEPCRKWAVKWFPDVDLPEAEDPVE